MLAYDICGQRKRDKQGNQPGPDLYLGHTEMSGQRSGPEDHKRHHGHATSHRVTTAQECEQWSSGRRLLSMRTTKPIRTGSQITESAKTSTVDHMVSNRTRR